MHHCWDPALYSRYEDERTRPAAELLARVPLATPGLVYDLGCGPGNSTQLLARRFPDARIVGVDNAAGMLASARARLPELRFEQADIRAWQPEATPELIFTNAALQWVPDHATLIPHLFALLAPGGVLAIQMPDNLDEPVHRLIRELAAMPPWRDAIGAAPHARAPLLPASRYYDLLAPHATQVDLWHTTYQHPLASAAAIVEWMRATGLRPFVEPLSAELRASYLAKFERRLANTYPPQCNGMRLLAYPRLFIVATRSCHP